jgi:hypothetical protein
MSRIENIITTTFRAHGGNVIATVGQMGSGMRNFGRIVDDNTRMSARLNQQWRAFGTTIRYALAGSVIFGASRLVGQIRDINQQLGQMQALSGIGGTAFSNRQINTLGNSLQRTALDTITPLNEVNDAAVNFLSTVQDVKPGQLPAMLTQIGQGAKLAQTPIEDLTQAATTFQVAFGRMVDPTSIGQFTRMWTQLIGVAPGGIAAAPTIAQAIPGLASMFQLAPGRNTNPATSQAQLMSLTLGVLRTGMPPATAMRGLTYFLQSIAQPTGKARGALAGIGITPQSVEREGIYPNAMRLLQRISARPGVARRLAVMPDETLDALDESGGNLPGIPAAEMTRLRTMIPRIHGIRAAIILASQLQRHGNVESLGGDLNMMLQAQNENSDTTRALTEAWGNLSRRSRLQQATNAVNTMGIQIASAFNPVFDFVSSGIALHLAPWMQNHRRAVRNVAIGGTAFLGAMTVGRALGLGNLPGLRNIPGLRGALGGRGFVAENAIRAAATGGAGLGASPQNPLYVVVVGEIFGDPVVGGHTATPGGGGGGGGAGGWLSRAVGGAMLAEHFGGRLLRGAGRYGARGLRYGAEMPAVGDFVQSLAQGRDVTSGEHVGFLRALIGSSDFNTAQDYTTALHRAQQLYPRATAIDSFHREKINGRAEISMTIDMTDSNGKKVVRRVHVPVDMWSGGRTPKTSGRAGRGTRK